PPASCPYWASQAREPDTPVLCRDPASTSDRNAAVRLRGYSGTSGWLGGAMIRPMTTLADLLLPDQLWQGIQPLLPPPQSQARGGAPRSVPDRACMAASIFMARTSTPWALLPVGEFGCGSVTS